jgi:hypothetical protein
VSVHCRRICGVFSVCCSWASELELCFFGLPLWDLGSCYLLDLCFVDLDSQGFGGSIYDSSFWGSGPCSLGHIGLHGSNSSVVGLCGLEGIIPNWQTLSITLH